jgi:hypothetical protein
MSHSCDKCGAGPYPECPPCPHQWQPIETAPRDGTVILIATYAAWALSYWDDGSWRWGVRKEEMEPTHWMPLPLLPEVTDGT